MNLLQLIAILATVFIFVITIRNIMLFLKAAKQKNIKEAGIRVQKIFTALAIPAFSSTLLFHLGNMPLIIGWGILIVSTLLPQKYFQLVAQKFMKQ